jgi:hypothetical protein
VSVADTLSFNPDADCALVLSWCAPILAYGRRR